MAGHSKWANIQHRKGAQDRKRAKIFSKASKAIITAVKNGGPDPDANLRLKYAIDQARSVNMPRDNIERAIKSAMGSQDADSYEELRYEGYGPAGVAVMLDVLTDNRNRTAPEVRRLFDKFGGNMGATGCVAHMFSRCAYFAIARDKVEEDRLLELALEAGADDVATEDEQAFEVTGPPDQFSAIKSALEEAGVECDVAKISEVPSMSVTIEDEGDARKILKLMDALDDHDDVQQVHSNFDIAEDVLAKVSEEA